MYPGTALPMSLDLLYFYLLLSLELHIPWNCSISHYYSRDFFSSSFFNFRSYSFRVLLSSNGMAHLFIFFSGGILIFFEFLIPVSYEYTQVGTSFLTTSRSCTAQAGSTLLVSHVQCPLVEGLCLFYYQSLHLT